jgi:hypothetical protein
MEIPRSACHRQGTARGSRPLGEKQVLVRAQLQSLTKGLRPLVRRMVPVSSSIRRTLTQPPGRLST